ncbi:hypothetical protein ABL78_3749 [Leptomonas seymouri]|uniref:Uncharacterized protein n=1 Tax=Leptomonas seymouri TaxID=5684 RepID=A0A0N0P6I1_LEPSE|nr:hypothetical protein ABL78_3749 [Leptomonas seymouri]|eukprot:KPI87187.1 hypothetical protein ABL78_3749 [Leptomonas seymouri]
MRGGFGRCRYERPQPGLQVHSYEDAIYPPRAYRYHVQQATTAIAQTTARNASHSGSGGVDAQSTAIVLPTIDADAACGPFLKSSASGVASSSASVLSASSLGYIGRSASSVASNSTAGAGFSPMDAERRPPPRLQYFFDCFVPDEDGTDVQSLSEVCRHAELLNPFHYRELWGGMAGEIEVPSAPWRETCTTAGAVKAEPVMEEEDGDPLNGKSAETSGASKPEGYIVKQENKAARPSAATRAATRAAQRALQRTLRALGLTDELSSMVLLAARVPPGGRLTRKQEKLLRLRHQRRPMPPRPIRRGAKVFMPAYALLAGGAAGTALHGLASAEATAATGGLIDVTAAGPRVLHLKKAAAHRYGAFGTVGGGQDVGYNGGGHTTHLGSRATAAPALLNEFAFDDDDEDEKSTQGRGGRRAGERRGRGEDEGLDEGDIPLIESGLWSPLGRPGGGGGGASGGAAGGGAVAAGQLDEEAEEGSDEEDDLSTGMAEDDDDDANFSSDGGNDNDSFGAGGDDGNDDY